MAAFLTCRGQAVLLLPATLGVIAWQLGSGYLSPVHLLA